ncbi:hypothetical protein Tco_0601376 [Tanacetum coccineum]
MFHGPLVFFVMKRVDQNGKLIYNSIMNGPYVRRMIPDPGAKTVKPCSKPIQTILLGLLEYIYAAVDSCETAQEIWLRVQQMMKGSDIEIQEKKAKLINEWERFTSTDGESIESYYHHFSKLMYDFKGNKHFPEKIASNLKFLNNLQPEWSRHEIDDLRAERLAKTHDPLALMANSNNPFNYPVFHPDQPSSSTYMQQPQPNNNYNPQPSFNQNYMQQPMPNPEDITDPTTAMNMTLVLMAKAFKLNYSTLTNNNQRISLNPRNRQIAQPGMNMGQDRHMQMVGVQNVGNQVVQNAVQNPRVQNVKNQNGLTVVPSIANQNPNRNGNVVAARAEGNANRNNGNQIRCYNCIGLGHLARNYTVRPRRRDVAYLQTQLLIAQKKEIEEVNANYILMANLQQALTSGNQTDKAPVYDSDGSAEVLLEKHDPPAVYDSKKTLQLAQESCLKIKQLNKEIILANYTKINHLSGVFVSQTAKSREELYFSNTSKTANVYKSISIRNEEFSNDTTPSVAQKFLNEVKSTIVTLQRLVKQKMTLDIHNWSSSVHQEIHKIVKDEIFPIVNQVDARVQNFEIQFLKEAAKFVQDFKSLTKEADESLAKHKALELEIERLLRAVISQDIMSIMQNPPIVETSNLQTELEQCNYDKISYDKVYKDTQLKIERLQTQLGDQKGKCKDTPCVLDTLDPLSQKLENKNVELEFQLRAQLFDKVSEQKDMTKGTSANTKFANQSNLKKSFLQTPRNHSIVRQPNAFQSERNSKVIPKVVEMNDLSKPVTLNSVSTPTESKVVTNDKVIDPGMFRIN